MSESQSQEDRGQRFQQIARQATTLWRDFLEAKLVKPWQLFDLGPKVNTVAARFFGYCAEVCAGVRSSGVVFSDLAGPNQPPFREFQGRPASWLWKTETGQPRIVVDSLGVIRNQLSEPLTPGSYADVAHVHKVVTRIILHEVGHLVLHWMPLVTSSKLRAGFIYSANPQQEEEAWWFCTAILSAALGSVAIDAREGKVPGFDKQDPAWRFA